MTRAAYPCDDPFCGGPDRGCGWTAPEHLRANQGGKDAAATQAERVKGAIAGSVRAMYGPPAVVEVEPPSTLEVMRGVLDDLDKSRPRSMQTALGPSELGTPCDRQIVMKLAGVPRRPADKRPPWAPMQGTAMHGLMEEALLFHNEQLGRQRWLIEHGLEIAIDYDTTIRGHSDAYDLDHDMVVDWKYVGSTALKSVSRKTVPLEQLVSPTYRTQGHLYGYGHFRAGREPKWVRLVLLARSHDYDDSREWTERWDRQVAVEAINRYYGLSDLVRKLPLAEQPALWQLVQARPDEHECAWCPFRRPGPVDGTGCPGNIDDKINKATAGIIAA